MLKYCVYLYWLTEALFQPYHPYKCHQYIQQTEKPASACSQMLYPYKNLPLLSCFCEFWSLFFLRHSLVWVYSYCLCFQIFLGHLSWYSPALLSLNRNITFQTTIMLGKWQCTKTAALIYTQMGSCLRNYCFIFLCYNMNNNNNETLHRQELTNYLLLFNTCRSAIHQEFFFSK